MVKQTDSCQCKGRCDSRRCKCLKNGRPCSDDCKCVDCKNPLNGMDVSKMSDCAIGNAEVVRSLTTDELAALIPLPCGHDPAPLSQLIGGFQCAGCKGEQYFYSFCYKAAEQESCTWHCSVCRTCRDWREWHCETCNRCTYGQSLPWDRCNSNSELFDKDW